MSKRSNSRKLAMRLVYQFGIRNADLTVLFADLDTDPYAPETVTWAYDLAEKTVTHLDVIDTAIAEHSHHWDMDRLNHVDKALLRMAIAEIHYIGTPFQVVINEILELSKQYSTEESTTFINGILDAYVKQACLPES
jgi:N utilization substance protein B